MLVTMVARKLDALPIVRLDPALLRQLADHLIHVLAAGLVLLTVGVRGGAGVMIEIHLRTELAAGRLGGDTDRQKLG